MLLQKTLLRWVLLLALIAAPASLAGSQTAIAASEAPTFPSPTAAEAGTTVRIDGSQSMSAINQALKQRYEQRFPDVEVTLDSRGTETAIDELLANEIDLAAIARPLTSAEKSKGLIEIPVSQDRIAVIVGRNNPFKGNLTVEQFVQILRGEITDWSQVGGKPGAIRVIDRPDDSDTRVALGRYGIFPEDMALGENWVQLSQDDTAEVVRKLGRDGIGYAIASQLATEDKARIVKIVVMHDALPDDPLYPYAQPRGYAYKRGMTAGAIESFLGFAGAEAGQEAVAAAKRAEAEAVVIANKPLPAAAKPAAKPEVMPAAEGTGDRRRFPWLWLLPLLLLGLLFRRGKPKPAAPAERAVIEVEPIDKAPAAAEPIEVVEPVALVQSAPVEEPIEAADVAVEEVAEVVAAPQAEPVEAVEPAREIAVPDYATLYGKGLRLAGAGSYEEAIANFDRAIELQPETMEVWMAKGSALVSLGQSGAALVCFDRIIQLQPDQAIAWSSKGDALVRLGRADEARIAFERAAILNGEAIAPSPAEAQPAAEPIAAAEPAAERLPAPPPAETNGASGVEALKRAFLDRLGQPPEAASPIDQYLAIAYVIRDYIMGGQFQMPQAALQTGSARLVSYFAAEFLPGPHLANNLLSLGMYDQAKQAMQELGLNLETLIEQEEEPGLGRGDLGRLGICYLDSLSLAEIPAIGYGIRYESGFFDQEIQDGWQVEVADSWLRYGNPWEQEQSSSVEVKFGGYTEAYVDGDGRFQVRWTPSEVVRGIPYDTPILGYRSHQPSLLRLWRADSADSLFSVLYPGDMTYEGKLARVKQQYFLVSCAVQDIVRMHLEAGGAIETLHERFALHLNDTDPILAIPELMRLLIDDHNLTQEQAWHITQSCFSYTNHSLLPEALDQSYPVSVLETLLPRHLQLIYDINCRFLQSVRARYPEESEITSPLLHERVRRMSIIDENGDRFLRMVHLACIGSHAVNGVSALHTELLKQTILPDYDELFPDKFSSQTNGISPRRFLLLSNPQLASLISSKIGDGWITNLAELRRLEPYADDAAFRQAWRQVKLAAKQNLAALMQDQGVAIDPNTLFDVQATVIHEYQRQALNLLHAIALYNRIKANPALSMVPRTMIFAGKAAPDYGMAKLLIKLIHSVAETINADSDVCGRLQVVFLKDFNLKSAGHLYPAADLSEHLTTAGTEACGTGILMFAVNGAVAIATPDGANPEVRQQVGAENIFQFGMTAEEVAACKAAGYSPGETYSANPELKQAIDQLASGAFSGGDASLFQPLVESLLHSDPYLVLADYQAYAEQQAQVSLAYQDPERWARMSILTTARMGVFSSDRAVQAYNQAIWQVKPAPSETPIAAQAASLNA